MARLAPANARMRALAFPAIPAILAPYAGFPSIFTEIPFSHAI